MRKIILLFCSFFLAAASKLPAQPVLYGLTGRGGGLGGGTISRFESGANNLAVAYAFKYDPKPSQYGVPIQADDGSLVSCGQPG